MVTTINEHGEKVTVIGTITDGRGGRRELKIVEFICCGRPCFSLKGTGGHADARRFSTQLKRAKFIYGDVSNQPEWLI